MRHLTALILLASATVANAQKFRYYVDGHITMNQLGNNEFYLGDQYTLSYTVDYGAIGATDGVYKVFDDAISDLQFELTFAFGGYQGGYAPTAHLMMSENQMYVSVRATTPGVAFADAGSGFPFDSLIHVITSPTASFYIHPTDPQTFASVLNGTDFLAFETNQLGNFMRFGNEDRQVIFNAKVAEITAIPEPSTYAAISGMAVLGLAVLRRRQTHRQG